MKTIQLFTLMISLLFCGCMYAQNTNQPAKATPENWTAFNREVSFDKNVIHLNAQANDGILWLNGSEGWFKNLKIY